MNATTPTRFEVLFDHAEASAIDDRPTRPMAISVFLPAPAARPWIYTNFVQSLDGITSLLGKYSSGGEISQSRDDRWLMDLLRAHADGIVMGMNTLREEQRLRGPAVAASSFRLPIPHCEFAAPVGKAANGIFLLPALPILTCRGIRCLTAT